MQKIVPGVFYNFLIVFRGALKKFTQVQGELVKYDVLEMIIALDVQTYSISASITSSSSFFFFESA